MQTIQLNSARNACGQLFTNAQSNFEVPSQRWSRARREKRGAWIFVVGGAERCAQTRKVAANVRFRDGADRALVPWTRRVQFAAGILAQEFLCPHLAANNRAASLVHTATETVISAA